MSFFQILGLFLSVLQAVLRIYIFSRMYHVLFSPPCTFFDIRLYFFNSFFSSILVVPPSVAGV